MQSLVSQLGRKSFPYTILTSRIRTVLKDSRSSPRLLESNINFNSQARGFSADLSTSRYSTASKTMKKIIIGCDGTWLNSDDGFAQSSYAPWASETNGKLVTPSNVTRICRALQPGNAKNGITQIVDYQPGIGSANNWWDHFVNGATAMSIGDNVNQAYVSIAEKYEEGDEVFIFGFSRGAFIARSIGAMIADVGLLTKRGLEDFFDIFQDWENQNVPEWKQRMYPYPQYTLTDNNDGNYSTYAKKLAADGLTRLGIRIKVLGCWDTVGSLGVPTVSWCKPTRSYAFVNTEPPWNVDHCFHAVALDEYRVPFAPTLWELPESRLPGSSNPCDLRQTWFPGVHSNIGGSVQDAELPNITLAWMVTQTAPMLDFDPEYLKFCQEINLKFYKDHQLEERKWAMGYIKNPMTGIQVLGGKAARTPGRYYRTDPITGRPKDERLKHTNEKIHPSVRIRRYNHKYGKGVDDHGNYDPPALKGWKLQNTEGAAGNAQYNPRQAGYVWEFNDPMTGKPIVLEEDKLDGLEVMLLDESGLAPTKLS